MPQLVLICGEGSGVGKTTLGERLVAEAAKQGLKTCVVKHVHHGVDYRVKDTGRYLEAGARAVAAIGPGEFMLVERRPANLLEAASLLAGKGCGLIVVEGLREEAGRVLELGGCVACISTRPLLGGDRAAWARPGKALEALPRLLELVSRGLCLARLPGG